MQKWKYVKYKICIMSNNESISEMFRILLSIKLFLGWNLYWRYLKRVIKNIKYNIISLFCLVTVRNICSDTGGITVQVEYLLALKFPCFEVILHLCSFRSALNDSSGQYWPRIKFCKWLLCVSSLLGSLDLKSCHPASDHSPQFRMQSGWPHTPRTCIIRFYAD